MSTLFARLRAVPLRAYPRVAAHSVRRRWLALLSHIAPSDIPDSELARALEVGSTTEIAAHFRRGDNARFFFPPAGAFERAVQVGAGSPGARDRVIARADAICAHRFDLLGSGPTDLGPRLPWRKDFRSGHEWPREHFSRLTIVDLEAGFDVKVPWELSRFHQAVTLGQAYAFTREEKYPREFVAQLEDWRAENPREFGPNWANAMEAAIRTANLIWAFELMLPALDDEFVIAFVKSLLEHGRYIRGHLEAGWPGSNHYIADLCGLIWLGLFLTPAPEAKGWLRLGLRNLAREMRAQVYPDGAAYEASTSYHLLVTEMILWTALYANLNAVGLPLLIRERLPKMLRVIAGLLRPDGSLPLFGDCDSGRWLALESDTDALLSGQDPLGVVALGSAAVSRLSGIQPEVFPARWRQPGRAIASVRLESSLWAYGDSLDAGPSEVPHPAEARSVESPAVDFPHAGWYVLRHRDHYLAVEAGRNGADGWGLHAHNDALSFELAIDGRVFLVDPGTFVYTPDYHARNLFRSTAMHNTVRIDGQEISRIPARDMFRMEEDVRVKAVVDERGWEGEHTGYMRLAGKVIHRRRFQFDAARNAWLMRDSFAGAGEHSLEWFFHFAPLPVASEGLQVWTTCADGPNLLIAPQDERLVFSLEEGWYSPRYGVRLRAPVARYSARRRLPARLSLILSSTAAPGR